MDELLKLAEAAIAKETPLKNYKLGVWKCAMRGDDQIVVILLDGRKIVYNIAEINMRAATGFGKTKAVKKK